MPLFYIVFDCSQDYVLIFAKHTTKYAGIVVKLKLVHTFYNSKELDRTVYQIFVFVPTVLYIAMLNYSLLKLLLTCLVMSSIELLKFRLASSAKWCAFEYFIARSRPLI